MRQGQRRTARRGAIVPRLVHAHAILVCRYRGCLLTLVLECPCVPQLARRRGRKQKRLPVEGDRFHRRGQCEHMFGGELGKVSGAVSVTRFEEMCC